MENEKWQIRWLTTANYCRGSKKKPRIQKLPVVNHLTVCLPLLVLFQGGITLKLPLNVSTQHSVCHFSFFFSKLEMLWNCLWTSWSAFCSLPCSVVIWCQLYRAICIALLMCTDNVVSHSRLFWCWKSSWSFWISSSVLGSNVDSLALRHPLGFIHICRAGQGTLNVGRLLFSWLLAALISNSVLTKHSFGAVEVNSSQAISRSMKRAHKKS